MTLSFVAYLYPKPDRVARVEELAQEIVDHVKKNEPGVIQYQWFRVKDAEIPTIMVWETYADQAAVDLHTGSAKTAWLMETEKKEENFAQPLKILTLENLNGWPSKQ
ncbi:hypothetical protein QBC34DRAFT_476378 [Podospora aff. communis PSN243]|uniref:ABM domain-containing protein n=1 Tax=Podospora aff. communis PSN243 TaxID=3040156 RepID=A0AAV9G7N0_9PEZI|nr:hypothetical protein QBC34DRAFT_476378 [Podospora aff. communis PSN243]